MHTHTRARTRQTRCGLYVSFALTRAFSVSLFTSSSAKERNALSHKAAYNDVKRIVMKLCVNITSRTSGIVQRPRGHINLA